jgi:hypothetical protein
MPLSAEFSERQYELAVNLELLCGGGGKFSVPSQRAEKTLGFDIELVPALRAIWSHLGSAAEPLGAGRNPGLSPLSASLFIQYKRPEMLIGQTAGEVKCRRHKVVGAALPYLRYRLEPHQLDALMRLQARVGSGAEVCYAVAGFISRRELHARQAAGDVMDGSNFLSMRKIEETRKSYGLPPLSSGQRHTWTFEELRTDGVLCSEPTAIEGVGRRDLMAGLLRRARAEGQGLALHLDTLSDSVLAWDREQRRGVKGDVERESPGLIERRQTIEPPQGELRLPSGDRLAYGDWRQSQGAVPRPVRSALDVYDAARSRGLDWHLALAWPRESASESEELETPIAESPDG